MTDKSATDVVAAPKRARRAKPAASRPAGPVRPLILGILNVTPDSFSDGGAHGSVGAAVEYAVHMRECGADIIDVGGESTRPGSKRLPVEEEQRRVLPVLKELAKRRIPVSIDTMNASTAAAAAERGAAIINDVSGGTADADMGRVAAETGLMFIAMHSRGPSEARTTYRDVVGEVRLELEYRVAALIMQGVDSGKIIVDPGIGFAKDAAQSWELLGGLRELRALGHPLLVGASRKRFLRELLPEGAKPRKRDAATAVISALSAEAGAWGVRVHDVPSTKAALDVWSAMNGAAR